MLKLTLTHLVEQKDAWIGQGHPQLTEILFSTAQHRFFFKKKKRFVWTVNASTNDRAPHLWSKHFHNGDTRFQLLLNASDVNLRKHLRWKIFSVAWSTSVHEYTRTHGWIDYGFPLINYAKPAHSTQPLSSNTRWSFAILMHNIPTKKKP